MAYGVIQIPADFAIGKNMTSSSRCHDWASRMSYSVDLAKHFI